MKIQLPIHGEERIVKTFAILPITCNSGEVVWLETAYVLQRYSSKDGWVNIQLTTKEEYEKVNKGKK